MMNIVLIPNQDPFVHKDGLKQLLTRLVKKVPMHKIVLCMAAYGYDWAKGGEGVDVTYQQALTIARESEGKVIYDNDTYNLKYHYWDEYDKYHEVHFTDAATNFNTLTFCNRIYLSRNSALETG